VDLSDDETRRMRQVVASLVAPMPAVDINLVPQPESSTKGFYVIAVPRSPSAPHAVLVNDALRFPKRNGSTTRYLSEPEVALAYRDRQSGEAEQQHRLDEICDEAIRRLDRDSNPWLLVALVPDLAGDMVINSALLREFRDQTQNREAWLVTPMGAGFHRARVGHRRLLADGAMTESAAANWVSAEYCTDGAGAYALRLSDLQEHRRLAVGPPQPGEPVDKNELVDDEMVAAAVLTGLIKLAHHARDRAAAGGTALVRAQLLPSLDATGIGIGHTRFHGIPESAGSLVSPDELRHSDGAANLNDLADPGPELVRVAASLCDGLGQVFGLPQQCQFTADGSMLRNYWRSPRALEWAESNGIPISDQRTL
jgi:hypothetical protein